MLNWMLKHIFLFFLFVFAVCGGSFFLLQLDEKVHVKQIAQFKENVRISAKMENAQERAENLLFSKETLKRMESNYADYLAFRDFIFLIVVYYLLVYWIHVFPQLLYKELKSKLSLVLREYYKNNFPNNFNNEEWIKS